MLSQRLARGSALAAQGQASAFAAVRDSRERFKVDLDALVSGGTFKGDVARPDAGPGVARDAERVKSALGARRRGGEAARRQRKEPDVARPRNGGDQPGQQRPARARAAGGAADRPRRRQLREVDYANQLAVLSQRIAKNAEHARGRRRNRSRSRVPARQGRDGVSRRDERSREGQRLAAPLRRCAPTTRARRSPSSPSASPRYQAGISVDPVEHGNLVVAKQAARSVNNEAEPLLTDTTKLADQYQNGNRTRAVARSASSIAFVLLALGCLAMVAQGVPDDARLARAGQRAREQAQPGSDPAAAERDGQPRRRRPDGAGVGHRGRHGRDRRLDQLHDRGAAHAGARHQLGDRPGDEGDAGNAGDLEPAVRGVAAAEPRDPAGVRVGADDGRVDQRGGAERRRSRRRWRKRSSPPRRRAAARCRTRSPA